MGYIMTYRLFGVKSFFELILTYCELLFIGSLIKMTVLSKWDHNTNFIQENEFVNIVFKMASNILSHP